LEKLIEAPTPPSSSQGALFDDNKDYTALLLNCYVKQKETDRIRELMKKSSSANSIFDVKTAIEVCR
jgi:hypothetical protein